MLLLVQLVAYGSLFLTTDDGAFHYAENELCLNMEQQFTISSNENIIVLLFDNLPNEWFEEARATYPDITKGLDRKSTRLNSSHPSSSRMPSSA